MYLRYLRLFYKSIILPSCTGTLVQNTKYIKYSRGEYPDRENLCLFYIQLNMPTNVCVNVYVTCKLKLIIYTVYFINVLFYSSSSTEVATATVVQY